jgi:uncharacterized spore protein YtfJ
LEDIFGSIEDMRDQASVSAVFGEPVEVGEKLVVPVADIKYGFGVGYNEGAAPENKEEQPASSGKGGGAGGGVAARPVAVLEISGDGVQVKPVMDEGKIALAGILTGAWFIFWTAKTLKAVFGSK